MENQRNIQELNYTMKLEDYTRRLEHFRQQIEEEIDPESITIEENLVVVSVTDMGDEDAERMKMIGEEFLENTGLSLTLSWDLQE